LSPIQAENFAAMLDALRARPHEHWIRQVDFGVGDQVWKLIIHAVALSGSQGIRAFLAVIEDITELEKMQRLAAWREVARRIAHEIKNPLTPIKLSAQRLGRRFGKKLDDPVFGQCTDLIVRQVERMQHMVEEFSSFAKLPETRLLPGDPGPLLAEVVTMFRTSHGGYDWRLEAGHLPRIAMDAEALHRALFNICANAADALAEKSAHAPDGWKGCVCLNACEDPERHGLRLTVEDNGPGLTPEERDRVFEPYYSRKQGGTGLGLAIVHSIVRDHRGEINASASASGGLALTLVFPPYSASQRLDGNEAETVPS
jgi:two-component system nitrogen regulation sensor histidine kinase NtrY